jgi:mRNA-degrading endonuclease YafQ of YafQ-DinJ toxin-antitoxin module
MYKIVELSSFRKDARRLLQGNNKLGRRLEKCLMMLKQNPFSKGLKTHKADTKLFGVRYSSRVTGDIRIIWDFGDDGTIILLLAIGGHDGKRGVYK